MAQYIDKDALVAEIERRIKEIDEIGTYLSPKGVLTNLLCQLNTLEVIEIGVDLGDHKRDKSAKYIIDTNTLEAKEVDLEKHLKEDIEDVYFDLNGVAIKGATYYLTVEDVKDIAKHFFELGLKSQKGE